MLVRYSGLIVNGCKDEPGDAGVLLRFDLYVDQPVDAGVLLRFDLYTDQPAILVCVFRSDLDLDQHDLDIDQSDAVCVGFQVGSGYCSAWWCLCMCSDLTLTSTSLVMLVCVFRSDLDINQPSDACVYVQI